MLAAPGWGEGAGGGAGASSCLSGPGTNNHQSARAEEVQHLVSDNQVGLCVGVNGQS